MSSYLDIAEKVLKITQRPMGPRAILDEAYRMDLVAPHLFGQTQHKTLQARLSEDILKEKDRSLFFRTQPGQFFLREFLQDKSIPEKYRQPIKARRRIRELAKGAQLYVSKDCLEELDNGINTNDLSIFERLSHQGLISFFHPSEKPDKFLQLFCFSIFGRGEEVLSYRTGHYRENHDAFSKKRTIGFTSVVLETDQTLFNYETFGLLESAISALSIDLDIPISEGGFNSHQLVFRNVVEFDEDSGKSGALVIIEAACPTWFEPTTRRLSMNDLQWLSFDVCPNHIEDFDPWSQAVIHHYFRGKN